MSANLWILTEERPKTEVLEVILQRFAQDQGCGFFGDTLRILPILDEHGSFTFTYQLIGFSCAKIEHVYLKTVSGSSSFCDFLVFYQPDEPTAVDTPLYAIEETKTDDSESRNTGVYQRCSKFVYIRSFYPEAKLAMLYHLQVEQKEDPTGTYVFGTRLLLTLGVEVWGKELDADVFTPYTSIDKVIEAKRAMRKAPRGNVPILLTKTDDKIQISGRLYKSGSLSHDPNIGALSLIAAALRTLGWNKKIEITQHGLEQKHVGATNKFVRIANVLDISLAGLSVPVVEQAPNYWHYEQEGEKLGTVFIHTVVESFTTGYSIFENHAGCEKGYFLPPTGNPIPLAKYKDREKYKAGDKSQIIHIPDLMLIDFERSEVINVEGKRYQFRAKGIAELANYNFIEQEYVGRYYPEFEIVRTVVLYGSDEEQVVEIEVGFLLNRRGKLVLGIQAPTLFTTAIKNLLDYWHQ